MAREPRSIPLAVARAAAVVFALAALTYFVVAAQAGAADSAGPAPEQREAPAVPRFEEGAAAAEAPVTVPVEVHPQYLPSSKSMVMPTAREFQDDGSSPSAAENEKGSAEKASEPVQPLRTQYLWSSKSGVIRKPGS